MMDISKWLPWRDFSEEIPFVYETMGGKQKYYFTLFGKCFSASGLGVYEAAMRIAKGLDKDILVVNDAGEDKGLVYLKSLCGDC